MARPALIRDEDLLAAAREVFLLRGMRATTAEVAKRAGVSEGTLFKRFNCKIDLFREAMGARLAAPPFLTTMNRLAGKGDVRANLVRLGLEMAAFFEEVAPLMMMAWSNPGPDGMPPIPRGPDAPPVRVLRGLVGFLEAEMAAGRLRPMQAELVARTFLGTLHNFIVFQKIYRFEEELPFARNKFVQGVVDLLCDGLRPDSDPRESAANRAGLPARARKVRSR